jgi:hypothetical protein
MKVGYAFLFIISIGSSFFLYIVEIVLVLNTTDVLLAGCLSKMDIPCIAPKIRQHFSRAFRG